MKQKNDMKEKLWEFLFENKIIVIGLVIFLIAPGIWTIFFFNRTEFWRMDIIKLLVISASMSTPVFACSYIILRGCRVQGKIEMDEATMVGGSSIYTTFIFFIVMLLKIEYPDMKAEYAMFVIIFLLLTFVIINIIEVRKINRQKDITNG